MGRSFMKMMIWERRSGFGLIRRGDIDGPVVGDGLIDVLGDEDPDPFQAAQGVCGFRKFPDSDYGKSRTLVW